MKLNTKIYCEKGFTLLEVMIALAIFGIVMVGVVKMFTSTSKYHTTQEMMVTASQNLRAAKQIMTYEIRTAGCNPLDKAGIGFQTDGDDRQNTDSNSIHFTLDLNGDGEIGAPATNENVWYYRSNDDCSVAPVGILAAGNNTRGCLRRDTGGGGMVVTDNVTELRFRYFDENDAEITAALTTPTLLDSIRTVEVTLSVILENTARVSAGQQTVTDQFRIRVRNAGL